MAEKDAYKLRVMLSALWEEAKSVVSEAAKGKSTKRNPAKAGHPKILAIVEGLKLVAEAHVAKQKLQHDHILDFSFPYLSKSM